MNGLTQLLCLLILVLATCLGLAFGKEYGGTIGAIVGCLMAGAAGYILCVLISRQQTRILVKSVRKEYADRTTQELRDILHGGNTLTPNLILMELRLRGDNIDRDIYPVLRMLESDHHQIRVLGYAALRTAYFYLKTFICDYSPGNRVDKCRSQVADLREWVNAQLEGEADSQDE